MFFGSKKKKSVAVTFRVSPPIYVDGGHIESILGPMQAVLSHLYAINVDPGRILAFGQNGACGIRSQDELQLHVVLFEPQNQVQDAQTRVRSDLITSLMQPTFDYAHLIAGFKNGIRLLVTGEVYSQNPFGESVMQDFFSVLFNSDNSCRWCTDDSNVLLLAGRSGPRAVFAKMQDFSGTFREIPRAMEETKQPRHAVIDKEFLLTCERESCKIHVLHQDAIAEFLLKSAPLSWHTEVLNSSFVEEIAVVDGAKGCGVLTVKHFSIRFLPFRVQIIGSRLSVHFLHEYALSRSDVPGGDVSAELVRMRSSGALVLSNYDGSDMDFHVIESSPFSRLVIDSLYDVQRFANPS